ncbi:MAG: DJ-1 family protein [Halothiobacillaceae bacterium]|nr:MAG: DJ-1 family protein [Halothiobacillaceae bacterium]
MIALPGGQPGANHLGDDPRIIELLQTFYHQGKYIAAICAAPKVLARAGLLRGKKATSFPGSLSAAELEGVDYVEHSIVHDGTIITSRGPGTAMDFALYLIELLLDRGRRDQVEQALQRGSLIHNA